MDDNEFFIYQKGLASIGSGIKKQEEAILSAEQDLLINLQTFAVLAQQIVHGNEERRRNTKERFNVFDALTRHHSEELHSRFLLYLLDPKESHDCGALFLKQFIETIFYGTESDLLEKLISAADKAVVSRELFIGFSADTEDYGRIDLFIKLPNLSIAIENKVYAGEQANQIKRYAGYCKSLGKPYRILYLTLQGSESKEAKGEDYQAISYEHHIVSWLDKCIEATTKYPTARVGINYYKELVLRRLLNKTPNQTLMDLKQVLLNENNAILINYASEISEALNEIERDLRATFFKKLVQELWRKYELEFLENMRSIVGAGDLWQEGNRSILVKSKAYCFSIGDSEAVYFSIEQNGDNIYYGLFGLSVNGGKHAYDFIGLEERLVGRSIQQKMTQKSLVIVEPPDEGWLAWRFYHLQPETPFSSSRLNQTMIHEMDKHVNELVNQVDEYLKVWVEVMGELKNESK